MGELLQSNDRDRGLKAIASHIPQLLNLVTTTAELFDGIHTITDLHIPKGKPGTLHAAFRLNREQELRLELKGDPKYKPEDRRTWSLNLSHSQPEVAHTTYYTWRGYIDKGLPQQSHNLSIFYPGGRTRLVHLDLEQARFYLATRETMDLPHRRLPSIDIGDNLEHFLVQQQKDRDRSISGVEIGYDCLAYNLLGIPLIFDQQIIILPTNVTPQNLRFRQ